MQRDSQRCGSGPVRESVLSLSERLRCVRCRDDDWDRALLYLKPVPAFWGQPTLAQRRLKRQNAFDIVGFNIGRRGPLADPGVQELVAFPGTTVL
jgi:hypothetical protein